MKKSLILIAALVITATRLLADAPADSIWREMLIGHASHSNLKTQMQKSYSEFLAKSIKESPEVFGQKGKSPSLPMPKK